MLPAIDLTDSCGFLCVSASGSNVDIRSAFEQGVRLELCPAIAFTLVDDAPLIKLARHYAYPDSVVGPTPAEPDGFLAVNSVLVTSLVFARAYRAIAGEPDDFPTSYRHFLAAAMPDRTPDDITEEVAALGNQRTISVLYSPDLEAAAVDLESRFVEAALGHLHISDFRNFGHGRHNWMAKRGDRTAVLSLSSTRHTSLAERTLGVMPPEIAAVRIDFDGPHDMAGLAGLIAALHVAAGAGLAIGVDPGRPGIPEFGRKLYRLALPTPPLGRSLLLERKRSAIIRVGEAVDDGVLAAACSASRAHIESTDIRGVALDYDGTLCDMRQRFDPLPTEITAGLERLIELGLPIGIATGRGQSVGKALRDALPPKAWDRIWVSYYNGAEGALLTDTAAPRGRSPTDLTKRIASALEANSTSWTIEPRASQVTVTPKRRAHIANLIAEIAAILGGVAEHARIVTSSHSVDILLPGVNKTNIVPDMERVFGVPGNHLLRIGDRGAAPGNDFDLLRHPLGLSVDEVSPDLRSCWRWSEPACLGPRATLSYLNSLTQSPTGIRLSLAQPMGQANGCP
jgi:hydroxymethylpyrimidine pyrophosphatase-like HAD family hydrolase